MLVRKVTGLLAVLYMFQGQWEPSVSLKPCVWVSCVGAPAPPETSKLVAKYDGEDYVEGTTEVAVGGKVRFSCANGMKSATKVDFNFHETSCSQGNQWSAISEWESCVTSEAIKKVIDRVSRNCF